MSSISLNSIRLVDTQIPKPLKTNGLNRFAQIFSGCDHTWSYVRRTNGATRQFLSAISSSSFQDRLPTDFPANVQNINTHFRIFSGFGLPFGLVDLNHSATRLWDRIKAKDAEGTAISSLSTSVAALDFFDMITTVVNATLTFFSKATVPLYSALDTPIAFSFSGLIVVLRTIRIAKACKLYCGISRHLHGKITLREALRLAPGQVILNENNRTEFSRAGSAKVIEQLEKILLLPENSLQVELALRLAKRQLLKEVGIQVLGILTSILFVVATILALIQFSVAAPYLLRAIAYSIKLATLIYQDFHLT